MLDRLFQWFEVNFSAWDRVVRIGPLGFISYVILGGEKPRNETISSWVGRSAEEGLRAGLIAEKVIDFFLGAGHCRLAIGK